MYWINNNQPPTGGAWPGTSGAFGGNASASPYALPSLGALGSDGYQPSWWNALGSASGATAPTQALSIIGSLVALLQQFASTLFGSSSPIGGTPGAAAEPPGPSTTFQNVALSSTGDPHLAISGTAQSAFGGTTQVNDRFDSMTGHRNLFSTNDFGDRFRVSTTTTTPDANGVTYNQSATASMNHGRDQVTMTKGGAIAVTSNGVPANLSAGQSITLSGGEVVTANANGSVSIAQQNANGESLTTTFSNNGNGIDVNATGAGGVTLGGDLVRHETEKLNPVC